MEFESYPLLPSRLTGREEGKGEKGWDGEDQNYFPKSSHPDSPFHFA
jgi:hypothetical protein